MSERTAEATTTVDEDGIRVEKSFTDDAFPVPAVMYELSSTREEPVRVRIVDRIPESFPMDRIGFHPEYESENWTAYKDHRVEFERVLDPGDEIETVFGIRDDDPDLDGFLGTPVIEHVPVGEEIEDVLGTGDTDAVREVLSGDRATLPGMEGSVAEGEGAGAADSDAEADAEAETVTEADPEAETAAEADAPEPRTVTAGGSAAVTMHDETGDDGVDDTEQAAESRADDTTEASDADEAAEAAAATDSTDADDATEESPESDESAPDPSPESGLAAALAAEIRAGDVADEDLETIGEELDVGVPRSVDVRISRLQSSVADIEAYADALAEFIDGEGTAREILDELDRKVETVESEMAALDDRVDAADADRDDLRETVGRVDDSVETVSTEVDGVTERVDGVSERVDGVTERVDGVESTVEDVEASVGDVEATVEEVTDDVSRIDAETDALDEALDDVGDDVETLYEEVDDAAAAAEATADRVEDVESRLGRFDEEFDDLWDDLAEVDTRLTEIEDRLGEDIDDVETELESINDHLEELEAFRKRLNEAFGP
ncbi:hypothetical protein [Halorubrum sp. Hd13]|uniref:hypothetical protein n=1 Tax=Halorubrum sp. Hd13 TaxID=1480728 RepID=UPI000B98D5A0|nr:hypothetical protein [Halorubrum sp. Hd13]OYR38275.1 hypothetical protein DJ81_18325 [Halorubrum sp. Hd13]